MPGYAMRISGFTFVRNAIDLYYPVVESITSILPICDEFVIAAGDSTDGTTALLRGINDPKIKIIDTVWDERHFVRGASNAEQSNIALDACTGDWAFYLQADEVVHERYLPGLVERMRAYRDDPRVEGLLFDYAHFFADYDHVETAHGWYRREVRIVRTGVGVRSWKSAQGFRRDGRKLHVALAGAAVYHYGWVRPPAKMTRKSFALSSVHGGVAAAAAAFPDLDAAWDFGRLWGRERFTGTHPRVMAARVAAKDWEVRPTRSVINHHDRIGNAVLSSLENRILGFRIGEHRNYILLPS
jgi:glycosyltransferase involved in cell wall biosynthesis